MSLTLPSQPRWFRSVRTAQEYILSLGISHLPIEPFDFYELNDNWVISSCKNLLENKKSNKLAQKILSKNTDAVTYYQNGFYVTIYNENFPTNRIRWTLAHEIGHILLKHFIYDETALLRGGLAEEKYGILEVEAHCFAAELLAPTFILYDLGLTTFSEETSLLIKEICCISEEAANKRAKTLSHYKYSVNQLKTRRQFENSFSLYLKRISICTNTNKNYYCNNLHKLHEVMTMAMKNLFCETDENNRFTRCPLCGNSVFSEQASFCKMCGTYLYNICTREDERDYSECGRQNPGDARFCEYCGAETILMSQGLLMTWEEIIEKNRHIEDGLMPNKDKNENDIDLNNLPF